MGKSLRIVALLFAASTTLAAAPLAQAHRDHARHDAGWHRPDRHPPRPDPVEAPLDVTIVGGPANGSITDAMDAAFAFTLSHGVGAECSLDGAPARPCTSPAVYEALADGPHLFVVNATREDAAGETESSSDRRQWIVAAARDSGLEPTPDADGDDDGDGIRNADDACAATPEGAAAAARGCAPVEIATNPHLLTAPLERAIDAARAAVGDRELFGRTRRSLQRPLRLAELHLRIARKLVARGLLCTGARHVKRAEKTLRRADEQMASAFRRLRDALVRRIGPDDGDADGLEVRFHELVFRRATYGDAARAAADAARDGDALCDRVVGVKLVRGRIVETLDAERLARLDDGTLLGFGETTRYRAMNDGVTIRAIAVAFDDRTALTRVAGSRGIAGIAPDLTVRCVHPRIAPFQRFNPPLPVSASTIVLHEPLAYRVGTTLELESAMRLGAQSGGCPTSVVPGDPDDIPIETYRYSTMIEYRPDGGAWSVVAPDLTPGEHPVQLPAQALPVGGTPRNGTLRFTSQVQTCDLLFDCTLPTPLTVDTYDVRVSPRGSLASLQYGSTLLALDDWNPNDFEAVSVSGVTLASAVTAGASGVVFDAQGYAANGVKIVVPVTPSSPSFAVYTVDLINPNALFSVASNGTDKRSGLRWPRAIGQRNGHTFWYSATPPDVIRDLVTSCFGPASFYRYPWRDGVTRNVGQGNSPPSTGSHNGSGQQFAFDFGFAEGDTIRAARGGTVDWVLEGLTLNIPPSSPNFIGSPLNWGNAVRIRHQDGSFAWYFHIEFNGALVDANDVVQRGQPIAKSGNTGRSSGPHLHFQVAGTSANWGQTIPISFACEVPVGGDDVTSNNANPSFP